MGHETPDHNPLRPILEAMVQGVTSMPIQQQGECIEYVVYVPIQHPVTGERVNAKALVHDHIIVPEQIEELEAHYALEDAHNTPDDYYDGKGD